MSIKETLKGQFLKNNIFAKYFILFAAIFLVVLTILGTTLIILVNVYTQNENTELLRENTQSISNSVNSTLIVQDMNNSYSVEKEMICNTLSVISKSIDADIFVCDVEGNIILCKEKADTMPFLGQFIPCAYHNDYHIGDTLLQKVYENGYVGKSMVNGKLCYIVGCPIYSDNQIIGSVFATTQTGVDSLALAVIRMFLFSAFASLVLGFICIWHLTKSLVTPLRQMSTAAKKFAVGDFSYRVKVTGSDELADLGKAFNDMADALDTLESSRRSFVSNVSHELRTPMTSIGGFIDGILDGTIPKEKTDYYLNIVSGEIRRLSRLVVAMLNMSKIESGSFEMKPNNYDITDQIIHILLTFEQKIEEKHIEIIGLEDLPPTYIVADTDMIYQVIYNIFDNAVKFTNEGGYIKVTLNDLNDKIEVHIKNSGIGIKQEELSKVFERFYKVDKSRSLDAKGAGLGLYIVKMMVEMHSGSIYAKSDDESSAEFVFTLPKAYSPIYKKEKK
ncbi:MAG: ATP-binding protein [Eubacterium sp.]